tara:strand:- start:942 stop:1370 length:429 start_codon:yes stop_codon:yes gene_type:complete
MSINGLPEAEYRDRQANHMKLFNTMVEKLEGGSNAGAKMTRKERACYAGMSGKEARKMVHEAVKSTKTAKGLVSAVCRVMREIAEAMGLRPESEVGMGQDESGHWYVWFDALGDLGVQHEGAWNDNFYLELEWGTRLVAFEC